MVQAVVDIAAFVNFWCSDKIRVSPLRGLCWAVVAVEISLREMSGLSTKVWMQASLKKMLISLNEELFRKNGVDVPRAAYDRYVRRVLNAGDWTLPGACIQWYRDYDQEEYSVAHSLRRT